MRNYNDGFLLQNAKWDDRCHECKVVIERGMMYLRDARDKVSYCLECADEMKPGVYNDAKEIQSRGQTTRFDSR